MAMPKQTMQDAAAATRTRFIRAASELFWRHGYHATSMSAIIDCAGSSSGNFYNFFDGKEELLIAVLESHEHKFARGACRGPQSAEGDPLARVSAVFDEYRAVLRASGFGRGCPVAKLALEMNDADGPVRDALAAACRGLRHRMAMCLNGLSPERDEATVEGLATTLVALLEGGVMQAQAERSLAPFDEAARHALAYLRLIVAN